MPNERAILCGDVSKKKLPFGQENPLSLHLWGFEENIRLRIKDIQEHLLREIPSPMHDLLEIATYVYCADQAVTRGGSGIENFGSDWRRKLYFRIAVRNPDLWNDDHLKDTLIETLSFLSDDEYLFDFEKLEHEEPSQLHLEFDLPTPEEVMMFSGGLDSLGGAIQESVIDKRKVALVMHKPTNKLNSRHDKLEELLAQHARHRPIHIPVTINKDKELSKEYTQRSRSFLYATLGATVANIFGLSRIRFYENGVISFNLPPSPQVVGARATRTTHPKVIKGFSQILSAVTKSKFVVENPFLWKTKPEVLEIISQAGCNEMIKFSTSCTHTWEMTVLRTHCGTCSQCIDRRFAVLAADLEQFDPEEAYGVDLLTGERKEDEDRTMLAAYTENAMSIQDLSAMEFFGKYGEAARVLSHVNGSAETTALKLFDLHKRHAKSVSKVIDQSIAKYARKIRRRELPNTCLLRLVCDSSVKSSNQINVSEATIPQVDKVVSDYIFQKKGQAWNVRYAGGREFILLPSKGAAYLQLLLATPNEVHKVVDLVFHVTKQPALFLLNDGVLASDKDALSSYRAKYFDLKEDYDAALQSEEQGIALLKSSSEIRMELDAIAHQLKSDRGLGNRIKRLNDDHDKVRKAFVAAITRVRKEIEKYDSRFAEHLKPPHLKCGWSPCYYPLSEISWDT